VFARICGGESVSAIFKDAPEGQSRATFYAMVAADEALADKYARAKQSGLDVWADDVVAIADETLAATECVAKARLQIDSRKWLLAKLAPKKYGELLSMDVRSQRTAGELSDDELARIALGGRAGAAAAPSGETVAD
jgi:hypothetical protein